MSNSPSIPRSVSTTPDVDEVAMNTGLLRAGSVGVIAPGVVSERKLTPSVNPESPVMVAPALAR
jgi:hypothetical protein